MKKKWLEQTYSHLLYSAVLQDLKTSVTEQNTCDSGHPHKGQTIIFRADDLVGSFLLNELTTVQTALPVEALCRSCHPDYTICVVCNDVQTSQAMQTLYTAERRLAQHQGE